PVPCKCRLGHSPRAERVSLRMFWRVCLAGSLPQTSVLGFSGVKTMFRHVVAAAAVALMISAPAFAADSENLQTFRAVQKQVLQYPHFTIFDDVDVQVNSGAVTLTG